MVNFTRIRAWQSARDFFIDVYDVTKAFPADERFGFTSQMRRAARSICADIAEGSGYRGNQDSARFYRMGFGSSSESYSDLYLPNPSGYSPTLISRDWKILWFRLASSSIS